MTNAALQPAARNSRLSPPRRAPGGGRLGWKRLLGPIQRRGPVCGDSRVGRVHDAKGSTAHL
jgi:hypothetical protein